MTGGTHSLKMVEGFAEGREISLVALAGCLDVVATGLAGSHATPEHPASVGRGRDGQEGRVAGADHPRGSQTAPGPSYPLLKGDTECVLPSQPTPVSQTPWIWSHGLLIASGRRRGNDLRSTFAVWASSGSLLPGSWTGLARSGEQRCCLVHLAPSLPERPPQWASRLTRGAEFWLGGRGVGRHGGGPEAAEADSPALRGLRGSHCTNGSPSWSLGKCGLSPRALWAPDQPAL